MPSGSFKGIVKPKPSELTLYVIGSSFGESSVVVLPTGQVIVIDSCTDGKENLTIELLRELKTKSVNLLVVTHSDLDHVRGLPDLLGGFAVEEAWRFPGAADVRTLASKWLRSNKADARLRELYETLTKLEELADTNACAMACADVRPWTAGAVSLTCLAPSQHDQLKANKFLDSLIRSEARGAKLDEAIADFFSKKRKAIGARPNVLSLATALEWAPRVRLVLGGDVERGDGSAWSGWRGVLATLNRRGSRRILGRARAVKAAHHGSRGAFEPEAWDAHCRTPPEETWAVIAPFRHGDVRLPDKDVLGELRGRGVRLAVCDAKEVKAVATSVGWKEHSISPCCDAPVISLAWKRSGSVAAGRGERAAIFVR